MRLSIVIVNWNTTSLLKTLIQSIRSNEPKFDYEIIVVDNASEDFSEDSFRAEFPEVKLIANNQNAGYAKGNNKAFEVATGEYILLLNPDTEVTSGAIQTLVDFMDTHKNAAAAGAKLVRPNSTTDSSLRSFPYPGAIAWEYIGLSKIFPKSRLFGRYRMTYFNYDKVIEVDQPMGSCLIISRKALEDIGSFDENFPIFFNEVDWLYRAKELGYKIYFTPDATVIHHGAASTKQINKRIMKSESHESLIRFYEKHYKGKIAAPIYYMTLVCIYISKLIRG